MVVNLENLAYLSMLGKGKKKKTAEHAEAAVPIILLFFVGILILGKLNVINLAWIPVIGSFFSPPELIVRIMADEGSHIDDTTNDVFLLLQSASAKERGITVEGPMYLSEAYEGIFTGVNVLILSDFDEISLSVRDQIGQFLSQGGKLLIIGKAGSKDPADPLVVGWNLGAMGDYVPADCTAVAGSLECNEHNVPNPKLHVIRVNHPLTKQYSAYGFSNLTGDNIDGSLTVTNVIPRGNLIATISAGGTGTRYPAVIESSASMMGGANVIYFAYNPTATKTLFLSAIDYVVYGG
jgi:hypothetical protein